MDQQLQYMLPVMGFGVVAVLFASRHPGYTAYGVPALTVRRALRRAEGPVDTGTCDED